MVSPLLKQSWAMSAVLINMFGQGLVLSYPSSLLPALNHPHSSIKVDRHTSSWLGSIVAIAGIPGFLMSSLLMASHGRRLTHGIVIIPGVVGWLLIYIAQDVPTLMMGRALGGFGATATVSLGAVVIGEYTCPKYRGVFLYLKNAAVCTGALFMHVISGCLHWRTVALVSLVPLIVAQLIILTWPESPSWLASKQQYERSEEAFCWLRGDSEASRRELDIISAQKAECSKLKPRTSCGSKIKTFFQKFKQKNFLKPLLIMVLATTVLEMSGRHILPAYALHIMRDITGETSQSYYYALGIDIIVTSAALLASFLVKVMNRRTLLFSTGFAALMVLCAVCLYLLLASKGVIPDDRQWIPILLLALYFILSNLGCAPIPLALVGEVFPLAHRGVGVALSGLWISLILYGTLKSTPHMLASVGACGFFIVSGSVMGVSLLVLYFIMPETKDRTLQEIENYFNHGKFTSDSKDEEANVKMINK